MLKVTVTPEHFKKATQFIDNENCPLAVALKEMFPGKHIMVYVFDVFIEGFPPTTADEDCSQTTHTLKGWSDTSYELGGLHSEKINRYIEYAKAGEEVPSFDVELIPVEE